MSATTTISIHGLYDEADEPVPIGQLDTLVPVVPAAGDDVVVTDEKYQFCGMAVARSFEYENGNQEVKVYICNVSWQRLEINGATGNGLTPEQREIYAPPDDEFDSKPGQS